MSPIRQDRVPVEPRLVEDRSLAAIKARLADPDLEELRRFEAAATPGPWRVIVARVQPGHPAGHPELAFVTDIAGVDGAHPVCFGHGYAEYGYMSIADAAFIAALRNAAPALLAAPESLPSVEGLAAALARTVVGHAQGRHEPPSAYDSLSQIDCRMPDCYAAALIESLRALRVPRGGGERP